MSLCINRKYASVEEKAEAKASGTRRLPTWCGKKSGYTWPSINAVLKPGLDFLPGTPGTGHFSTLPCQDCLAEAHKALLSLMEER